MNKPVCVNCSSKVKRIADKATEKISNYFGNVLGYVPYFNKLKVYAGKLPDVYRLSITKSGPVIEKIGRILGMYDPETKTAVVEEREDKYGNISPIRVLGEEMIHYAQDAFGAIKRYYELFGKKANKMIEGAASYTADKLFEPSPIYRDEKREYEEFMKRVGEKGALTGATA
jgi:hypothetical protein